VASSKPGWQVAYYAALLAANTTARGCELKGLRLADVNLLEKTLTIRRASTKTDAGARVVPLNETAQMACARLLERARKLGALEPEHHLFPASLSQHTKPGDPLKDARGYDPTMAMRSWRTAWRHLTVVAGLRGSRFHDLRHHSITKLAEAGTPDHTLMAIAGHVSHDMLEHYSHIRMQPKRDAVAALELKAVPRSEEPLPAPMEVAVEVV
jgi:integrase